MLSKPDAKVVYTPEGKFAGQALPPVLLHNRSSTEQQDQFSPETAGFTWGAMQVGMAVGHKYEKACTRMTPTANFPPSRDALV